MEPDVPVVIMAAGLGTRMRSKQAKVLHRAGGRTLIEHVLAAAAAIAPADQTFVVIGHQAERVRELLGNTGVGFIHQAEQKGTGHAVMCGRGQLASRGGLLVVLNGDGPLLRPETLTGLVQHAAASEAAALMITANLSDPTGYGRIVRDAEGNVRAIVEQKAATAEQLAITESNTGQYCFQADLFWHFIEQLRPDNAAGEYYLTDMIEVLIRAGYRVQPYRVDNAAELMGINNRVELAAVDALFRARTNERLMLAGVTMEMPETVTVDEGVRVGMDTIIEPFARLLGRTHIGENCRIGAYSILTDAVIEDGVAIHPFTTVQAAHISHGAQVGPYSRIRPGSMVRSRAHIGNFVELKNAEVGEEAKAMHLAYLGDCAIGAKTNIGAGTITCNYDGVHKHRTEIGKDAFVGSNSTLVAPIEIGDGAYVGAGSVITDPVPHDALALGRARQVVKDGWAKRKRDSR